MRNIYATFVFYLFNFKVFYYEKEIISRIIYGGSSFCKLL